MNKHYELKDLVSEPARLAEVCREVVEAVVAGTEGDEVREKESQLREIARTVDRLEKLGVAVPDGLRGEKTRLAAELSEKSEGLKTLNALADALQGVLDELKRKLGRNGSGTRTEGETKRRPKRDRLPKTSKAVLCEYVVLALRNLGGRAQVRKVIDEMEKLLKGKLLPADMEWRESAKEYVWQNDTRWHYKSMKKEGILCSDVPSGTWQLNERQR
jgi:hypothetical protein